MSAPSSHDDVTSLLQAWYDGNPEALEKLTPLVYKELHQAAKRYMAGERAEHTLQATALVNEVYLRLVNLREISWQNRSHFLAVCANLMRQILTDFARSRLSLKRGAGVRDATLNSDVCLPGEARIDILALDEAMERLAELDPRKSRVVEMRFFGGMNVEETAEVLKVSVETVQRDWKFAKFWLHRELSVERPRAIRTVAEN